MLMDLFYNTLPPSITRKRRVHFHAFMVDVHRRIHAAKIAMGPRGGDPIPKVAQDLAEEASVLCIDEFQVRFICFHGRGGCQAYHRQYDIKVTDIADAMILRRLLENLMDHGVVMVITSK